MRNFLPLLKRTAAVPTPVGGQADLYFVGDELRSKGADGIDRPYGPATNDHFIGANFQPTYQTPGTWVGLAGGGPIGIVRYQSGTPATNDEFGWDVVVRGGTYTITWFVQMTNNSGIWQPRIDGADSGATFDAYSASSVDTVITRTGLALTAGSHRIGARASGKHASSSSYYLSTGGIALYRTGA
jgi:hypothetical protein